MGSRRGLCVGLVVCVVLGCSLASSAATCSNALIKGIYGLTITGFDSANLYQDSVTQINANGKGKFTGIATVNEDGTVFNDMAVTGTYSIAANCTGTGTITNPKNGNVSHYNLVYDAVSKQVEFVGTDAGHGTASGAMVAQGAATTCTVAAVKGTYGFYGGGYVVGNGVQALTGQLVLDGAGNVTGSGTDVIVGNVQSGSITGTYTIAANCTGTLTTLWNGQTGHFNLVVTGGGKGFSAIITDTTSVTTVSSHQ